MIIAAAVVMCAACGKAEKPLDKSIKQVEAALEKVEQNKDAMTKEDWDALGKEMEAPLQEISTALESDQVSATERIKLLGLVTKMGTVMGEAALKQLNTETGIVRDSLGNELKEAGEQIEGAVGEAVKAAGEAAGEVGKAAGEVAKEVKDATQK